MLFLYSCLEFAKHVRIGRVINCCLTSAGSRVIPSAWTFWWCKCQTVSQRTLSFFFKLDLSFFVSRRCLRYYYNAILWCFTSQLKSWCYSLGWVFPPTAIHKVGHTVGFYVNGNNNTKRGKLVCLFAAANRHRPPSERFGLIKYNDD